MKYHKLQVPNQTTQAKKSQVKNNAGGYVFQLDLFKRLDRFLILGSDKNTYYQKAGQLTVENAQCVNDCWAEDPARTAKVLLDVQKENRAPKRDPMLFALALGFAHDKPEARQEAKKIFHDIVTNAASLFSFLTAVTSMRGWGRSLTTVVREFYEKRPAEKIAYQAMKYKQRDKFSHKRVIELSHPRVGKDQVKGRLFQSIRGVKVKAGKLPANWEAYQLAHETPNAKKVAKLITEHRLPWEAVPTELLKDKRIQEALLPGMPMNALLRQLGTLTKAGVLKREHVEVFLDEQRLKKSKLHPYQILVALKTYASGKGFRSEWTPKPFVQEILNDAFYLAFKNVEPTGKRTLIAIDVSGSMGTANIQGGNITAREAAAAMCMVTIQAEKDYNVMAFGNQFHPIALHKRMSLEETVRATSSLPFGNTDCSLPMLWADKMDLEFDTIIIYTDNETYAGRVHPYKALEQYQKKTGLKTKLVVVGMTSTGFSIADPSNPHMLDVVGFDASAPSLISDFSRGSF